jgi:hypothetical protein
MVTLRVLPALLIMEGGACDAGVCQSGSDRSRWSSTLHLVL